MLPNSRYFPIVWIIILNWKQSEFEEDSKNSIQSPNLLIPLYTPAPVICLSLSG